MFPYVFVTLLAPHLRPFSRLFHAGLLRRRSVLGVAFHNSDSKVLSGSQASGKQARVDEVAQKL